MKTRSIKKDIAIIGMSGRFPKSENIREFWENLASGKELTHLYTDQELEALGVEADRIGDKNYIRASSSIKDPGNFDFSFFGYTKEEAGLIDPQVRVLHEQAWLALENAGYDPFNYTNKIGCFFSASDNINWRTHVRIAPDPNVNSFYTSQIAEKSSASRLISYALDLKGPSYHLDTACSSSLVAIHMACRSLLMKECAMALAGGASIGSTTSIGYMYEEGMILSKDGHCKTFDAGSSGTIPGEGVGVVVLKRLEDALNDRDHIYSVIRASSVNNDGNRKVGFTAPSITGQYECIKVAHQIAEVAPEEISYIEAHGTATKLGDSVEIEALNKAFGYTTSHSCAIGSVKSNMGHLDAAAGVAGLIKTALTLNYRMIPPLVHFKSPNPEINFEAGPFYVNTELKPWVNKEPFLAGVSGFGIGGTNAHVIMEEPPASQKGDKSRKQQLLIYSAKTKTALNQYEQALKNFLEAEKELDLADLAYTLKVGRHGFKYRKFLVCETAEDAKEQLNGTGNATFQAKEQNGIVFMFAGQGSQYYQMGKELYLHYPYFKTLVDEGFSILKKETGTDYAGIIGYTTNAPHADNESINDLAYSIPLLFLLEYAFAKLLLKLGIKPANMIGHSFGEYVAACLSEVFSFEDGLKLVVKRAQLMNGLEKGAMVSIDLPVSQVLDLIPPGLSIAAVNTESSCVVSGSVAVVEAFCELLQSKEVNFIRIRTSHAGHSSMMDPILAAYEHELTKIRYSEPKLPFISCITGKPITKEEAMSPRYWVEHLRQTVCFSKGLTALLKQGKRLFVEIGSGKTLSSFLMQNVSFSPDVSSTAVMRHPKDAVNDVSYLLQCLGRIWSSGVAINWKALYEGEARNRIPAPGYAFDKIEFEVKVDPVKKLMEWAGVGFGNNVKKGASEWLYEQGWKEIKNEASGKRPSFDWTLCFLGDDSFASRLRNEVLKDGKPVIFVSIGTAYSSAAGGEITIDPASPHDYERLYSDTQAIRKGTGRILHAWCVQKHEPKNNPGLTAEDRGYFSLLEIARVFLKKLDQAPVYLDLLVIDLFNVNGDEKISALHSTALAAVKGISREFENVHCRSIEFRSQEVTDDAGIENVFSKLRTGYGEETIAVRGRKSWKPFYEQVKVDQPQQPGTGLKKNGLYVITGANGAIAKAIGKFLVEEYDASLILIGRSAPEQALLERYKKEQNTIDYIQDDLGDFSALKAKATAVLSALDVNVSGVFHTAGIPDYGGLIVDRKKQDCHEVFLPKVKGTDNLFGVFHHSELDLFVLCSSLNALTILFGQVAYAAANTYQNFFAQQHSAKTRMLSILWCTWKDAGMALKAKNRYEAQDQLSSGVTSAEGIELLKYALHSNSPEIVISQSDLTAALHAAFKYTLKAAFDIAGQTAEAPVSAALERPFISSVYLEPVSATEIKLTGIWKSVLGYETIGIDDNFFELGGNSLKVMTVIKRIHHLFNVEVGIGDFFRMNTVRQLSREIELATELKGMGRTDSQAKKTQQIRL